MTPPPPTFTISPQCVVRGKTQGTIHVFVDGKQVCQCGKRRLIR